MTVANDSGIHKSIYDNGNNLLLIRKIKMTTVSYFILEPLLTLIYIPPSIKRCTLKLQN